MNTHSLRVLEYETVLHLIGNYAASEPGRDFILRLRPGVEPGMVERLRSLFSAFLTLRRQGVCFAAARFESPEQALVKAAPERAVLDPEGFAAVRQILRVTAEVRAQLVKEPARCLVEIQELVAGLEPCPELVRALNGTFDERCEHLLDTASERLRTIRGRILALQKNIQSHLESMLRDPAFAGVFQEDFIALRHGRYVVTVKREARHRIRGIVHDQSNSGMTLYIEPESVIESGNELECLRLDERDEIRRILGRLTIRVRQRLKEIRRNFESLCLYDAAYAVSAWGREYECIFPDSGQTMRLVAARHPLLQHRFKRENRTAELVPLDLEVPPGKNVIVITGSNTGGKTVALKTIGLLTLMARAGLPVPAGAGTVIPPVADVLADIGDEQSIEQSLSTFSAHLSHIVGALNKAQSSASLVLLDELGAGTDPVEGGALACAILNVLSGTKSLTFATTHLGAVKRFVHAHPRMENASMLFDIETLRPQYRLVMGHPGASYALEIAARRGLSSDVIETARTLMDANELRLENMLAAMDQKHIRLDREIGELERAREDALQSRLKAVEERDRIREELKELRRRRRELLHQAQEEAAALVANVRRETEQILSQLRKNPSREQVRELRHKLQEREERLQEGLSETEPLPEDRLDKGALSVGARVWIRSLRDHGTVTAIGEGSDRVTVEVGGIRVEVGGNDLAPPRDTATVHASGQSPVVLISTGHKNVPMELNLIGQRVEMALGNLERFLNAALLAGLPEVRIVHGHGTGVLQRAVHEYLQQANIRTFRLGETGKDPGGTGVTIVTL